MKRIILCFAVIAAIVLSVTVAAVPVYGAGDYTLENESFVLDFDEESCGFTVTSKKNGLVWYSSPVDASGSKEDEMRSLIVVDYTDTDTFEPYSLDSYSECVLMGDYSVKKADNCLTVTLKFDSIDMTVPLKISLAEDGFRFSLLTEEIEIKEENVCIRYISVLPYFEAAAPETDGYLFIPDGSGALISFAEIPGSTKNYSAEVYGTDYAYENQNTMKFENITMPVFGAKLGDKAYLAIIEDGAAECSLEAYANNQRTKYANAYARLLVGKTVDFNISINSTTVFEKLPIKNSNVTVFYNLLSGDNADYTGMALCYRDYLEAEGGFTAKKDSDTAVYLDVYAGTVTKKSAFFFTYNGYTALTTVDELAGMIEKLQKNGTKDIKIRYLNSNKSEAFSKITSKIKFVGGLKGDISDLDALNKIDGVTVYPAISNLCTYTNENYIFSKASKGVEDLAEITVRKSLKLNAFGDVSGESAYFLKPRLVSANLEKIFSQLKKKNVSGIAFSDVGNRLYTDYSGNGCKKEKFKNSLTEIFENASKNTKLCFEDPNIYAAKYASDIVGAPVSSSGYDIFDTDVPFWQIVMSRFNTYSGELLNGVYTKKSLLKAIETNTNPRFVAMERYNDVPASSDLTKFYSASLDAQTEAISELYTALCELNAKTEGSVIAGHSCVAKQVFCTEYENGTAVYVNYSEKDFTLADGATVPGGDYTVKAVDNR
ncbi:MAG: hypothetical protein IKD04_03350 [Clostridia bacterium]|nr:hypothetical protein [Clostridia bacterium]